MSHTFTVALFGHRITTDFKRIEENLTPIIKDLIKKSRMSFSSSVETANLTNMRHPSSNRRSINMA